MYLSVIGTISAPIFWFASPTFLTSLRQWLKLFQNTITRIRSTACLFFAIFYANGCNFIGIFKTFSHSWWRHLFVLSLINNSHVWVVSASLTFKQPLIPHLTVPHCMHQDGQEEVLWSYAEVNPQRHVAPLWFVCVKHVDSQLGIGWYSAVAKIIFLVKSILAYCHTFLPWNHVRDIGSVVDWSALENAFDTTASSSWGEPNRRAVR